jgi:site-specific recombinase XerC
LNYAQKRGLIAYNPASPVRIDTRKRDTIPIRLGLEIPDRPEIRKIFAASVGRWLTFFSTASFAGMRSSELRGLPWPNVRLDAHKIDVRQRADRKRAIGLCKSAAAYRTIQIGDDLVEMLRWWKLICPPSDLDLVFPDDDGNVLYRVEPLNQLKAIQDQIGMKRANGKAKYTVHSLRHFYASIMIDEAIPIKRLQYLLGHSTIELTMDTYGHLFPEEDAQAARINSAMASVFRSDTKRAATLSNYSTTKAASASVSVTRASAPTEWSGPDGALGTPQRRPTLGTRSTRAFGPQGAGALPRAPASKTAPTPKSKLLKRTPGRATKDAVFVEPGLKGWTVKIGARTLGPYRTYGEACATMQGSV